MTGCVGQSLLQNVETESFGNHIAALHSQTQSSKILSQVPALNKILRIILSNQTLDNPPVLEITSTSTGMGKTHIFYHLASLTTLPPELRLGFGVGEAAILIFDCDGRFDVCRLYHVMYSQIQGHLDAEGSAMDANEIDVIIRDALKHVYVYRPESSTDLIATINRLSEHLLVHQTNHSSGKRRLDAILVDNISAFFWQDKPRDFESIGQIGSETCSDRYRKITEGLRDLSKKFGAYIIASNWGIFPIYEEAHDGTNQFPMYSENRITYNSSTEISSSRIIGFRSHLPQVWSQFVNVKIVVTRRSFASKCDSETTVAKLVQKKYSRGSASARSFMGWVDTSHLKPAIRRSLLTKHVTFHYEIDGNGIEFNEEQ